MSRGSQTRAILKPGPPSRPEFPSLKRVLEDFVNENGLSDPSTVTPIADRGLLVYWDNEGHVNLYSSEADTGRYWAQIYNLQGDLKIPGSFMLQQVHLRAEDRSAVSQKGQEPESQIVRHDRYTEYIFLGESVSRNPPKAVFRGVLEKR